MICFFTILQYHKQSQHTHNNIKSTSNGNSCHISVVPRRITFKLLQGRGYRLIRSLLLRSIFPNQSFTELSITACKSYPVLFHLYIMTFSHTCTHIQTHTWMCLMRLSAAVDTIHHFKSSTKGSSSAWLVLSGAPRPQCTPSRLLCSRRN